MTRSTLSHKCKRYFVGEGYRFCERMRVGIRPIQPESAGLRLEPNDVRAPIGEHCTSDIRRVLSRHVRDATSVYRRAGVITPSRHSIAAEFRIAGKTIFRFVPSARDPYRADSCVINR